MRILFFLQPGSNSRSIFADLIRGFERAGHQPRILELAPIWAAYDANPARRPALMSQATARIRDLLIAERIDAAACMWGNALTTLMHGAKDGQPVTLFDELRIPLLCYWLDAPHWAQAGSLHAAFGTPILRSPMLLHAINNRATAREMSDVLGFGRVLPLPYGVNERAFAPAPAPEFDLVASVGPGDPSPTPHALFLLDHDDPPIRQLREHAAASARADLRKLIAEHPSQSVLAPLLDALVQSQLDDRHAPMLDRIRRLRGHDALLADPRLFVKATMRIRAIESHERAFTISWLSRRLRVATFGSADLAAWSSRATHLGELRYESMPAAYSRGRLGLNVMRWQDDAGLNLKPFEITAGGVACLCARRAGLDDLFTPGLEIQSFEGPADALAKAASLLKDPDRLQSLAQAGRARTLRDHTWTHRAGSLAAAIAEPPR